MVSKFFYPTRTVLFSVVILLSSISQQFARMAEPICWADELETIEIPAFAPHRLGTLTLLHNQRGFAVVKDGKTYPVENHDLDEELRGLSNDELISRLGLTANIEINGEEFIFIRCSQKQTKELIANNQTSEQFSPEESEQITSQLPPLSRIEISQYDNGDYKLRLKTALPGAGPFAGAIGYWFVKTVCYGTAVAATGAAVVATGGAAGAVTGTIATASTLGASTGATLVGGAIAGAGLTAEAATATTVVVGSAGGISGAIAAVEGAATGAWFLLGACPWLP